MDFPKEVEIVIKKIEERGYEAFLVGGCVRDILRGVEPHDFDVATNASPEEIKKIFKKSFYDNVFGTVTVLTGSNEERLKKIEVTTYREEEGYNDQRHPEKVNFVKNIEDDLKRRDFTINAMAISLGKNVIDPFSGKKDLEDRVIRAVGNPKERFSEDALRMMRAVRFFCSLNFEIEKKTKKAIKENAELLKNISSERIRDEFVKIMMTPRASEGVEELRKLSLLEQFLPELVEGYEVAQSKHHIYDCYKHSIYSLRYAVKKNYSLHVRMAALLHDIGKPRSKEGEGEKATFHNHEIIGAKMTRNILNRLKFKKEDREKIVLLVRYHLFYYNVGEVTESSVRRLLRKVGRENIDELLEVRMADRIGSGVPKAEPYRLRHMRYLIEKVSQDAIDTGMLKITGNDVMEMMSISPGPLIGDILNILLLKVINEPELNSEDDLKKEIEKIKKLKEEEIKKIADDAKKEIEKVEIKRDEMTKKRYWVT
jgi:tRNA nucleotidyltransferase (CCA-adding enzyme)